MREPASPVLNRLLWLASASLLLSGTVFLVFGLGWTVVATLSGLGAGAEPEVARFGWTVFGGSSVAILAGAVGHGLLQRIETDGRALVQVDFDRPVVGLHGPRRSPQRLRVEARISVTARRGVVAIVRDRADDISQAAAEALALMGPRAVHGPDRALAEQAIAEVVNRSLRARVVRSIRFHGVRALPAQ